MNAGVAAGNFTLLADMQASNPTIDTNISLTIAGERTVYLVQAANAGSGVLLDNTLYANPVLDPQIVVNTANIANVFSRIRYSLIDNPLCHLFKTNKLVEASAPTSTVGDVTWTRSTTATYIDRYDTVQTAAIDTPREEKEGFLIEGASTNLALYSEQFDNAVWTNNVTLTPNSSVAPDGLMTAYTVSVLAVNWNIRQSIPTTLSVEYTFSIWVKSNNLGNDQFTIKAPGVSSGALVATTEWARYEITGIGSGILENFSIADYNNNACDVLIWGAQLEELPFATRYIKTTTAAATRTADNVSVAALNNAPQTTDAMSLSMSVNIKGASATNATLFFSQTSGADTFGFRSYIDTTTATNVNVIGSTNPNAPSFPINATTNHLITYDTTSMDVYKNGVSGVSLPYVTTTKFIDTTKVLYLGRDSGSEYMFGHIKDFRVYDFKLNQDEATYLAGQ
jgi:hypothetical protein